MSQEIPTDDNIGLVRHALGLFNAGDVDAFVDLFTDDGEVETDPRFVEGGTFTGRESVRRFLAGLHQGWEGGSAVTVKEMWPAGNKRAGLLELARQRRQERHRRVIGLVRAVDARDGRITRLRFFYDRAEALEAAGLRE
jgi:ketosteroid isomerase-like protein